MKGLVLEAVRDLLETQHLPPSRVVLIAPRTWASGPLNDVKTICGVPLTDSAKVWRGGRHILRQLPGASKGLEADAAVLYDIGEFSDKFSAQLIFTSRAHVRLPASACDHKGSSRGTSGPRGSCASAELSAMPTLGRS